MGPLMYIFFGTVREISVGPNSVLALMINSYVSEGGVAYAVILAFLTGVIQLIIGLLNLGKISLYMHVLLQAFVVVCFVLFFACPTTLSPDSCPAQILPCFNFRFFFFFVALAAPFPTKRKVKISRRLRDCALIPAVTDLIHSTGFIVDLISAPVISGFCSAAALTAIATQMKGLLGLKFQGSNFLGVWRGVFENLSDINYYDAGLGFLTIFILLIMRVSSHTHVLGILILEHKDYLIFSPPIICYFQWTFKEAQLYDESRGLQGTVLFTKSLDFPGVVVPFIQPQRFCSNIQLSGSVPVGNKWIESIDLVRYTEKNAVFSYFLFSFLYFVCTKKKPGESCIVASLQPPSFYFISLFSSVALFIFSLSLIFFFFYLSDLLFV
jgi:hypothetical protein